MIIVVMVITYSFGESGCNRMGWFPNVLGCIPAAKCGSIKAAKGKGAAGMEDNPTIAYITSMLRRMRPETVRAVYMVVQELDRAACHESRVS